MIERPVDAPDVPLSQVTFCVIDVETTGADPGCDALTEVAAVKVRGGECLGTFSSLVRSGRRLPGFVTVLTGITEAMLAPAPPPGPVLAALAEFAAGCVLVGHHVRFDLAFLGAAYEAHGWPRPAGPAVDTLALARRLLRAEVPDLRLATLADRLRLDHRPAHRALPDALATTDLLHALVERSTAFGVATLGDLLALPTVAGHPQAAKLSLTTALPRAPGVYLFRGPTGEVLYVGKATDLRSRVRSYWGDDDRRTVAPLLREVHRIDHVRCTDALEAAVVEVRLVQQHRPRYNRHLAGWDRSPYLTLTVQERFPRLAVVRTPRPGGAPVVGPLASAAQARLAAEAIETVVPLRRCTAVIGRRVPVRPSPCTPAQLGVATCPCAGGIDERAYAAHVATAAAALTDRPHLVLDRLAERIARLAAAERFEEAAACRDRAAAFAAALGRQRRFDRLRQAGTIVVEVPGPRDRTARRTVVVHGGVLAGAPVEAPCAAPPAHLPLPRELAAELAVVASWLDRPAPGWTLLAVEGRLASALPALGSFLPARPRRPPAPAGTPSGVTTAGTPSGVTTAGTPSGVTTAGTPSGVTTPVAAR